eukprot:CAMPEP_0195285298 /NCGR_PEP_ID=MMETSP0707-20130614/3182_1 /TAXON_ID=33640 /ORGANISM="Asterionellopsis glacialis, Strain CCMP134" /LENGTH=700 /DNA_ID=CAMNT_0040344771 /DNA_START=116 /DNA_END=2218 /DNA_ORIENTATION=+
MKIRIASLFLLMRSFADASRILRGSSSGPLYQRRPEKVDGMTAFCPASPAEALDLIVEEEHNDDNSANVGNVWVRNHDGKTCVHVDIDEASIISDVHIYYKCTPPSSHNPQDFNHHPIDFSVTSWCFDTLKCNNDDESTSATRANGFIAFHLNVEMVSPHDNSVVPDSIQRRAQEEADCTPFVVADQAAVDEAILPYANETELGIRFRTKSGGRWDSFFTVGGLFNQTAYRGWCVDSDDPMCVDCAYPFDICSSYRDDFSGLEGGNAIDNITNLPAANWLINKYPVNTQLNGNDPLCPVNIPGEPIVTWRMFQAAIWKIVDYGYNSIIKCEGNSCEDAADVLVACAMAQGYDYRPTCCDEIIGVILVWDDDVTGDLSKQEILVEVPLVDIPGVCVEEPPIDLSPPSDPDDPCYDVYINTTAVTEAIQPWANEALMNITFRNVEGARLDAFFTVEGLLNISGFAAWCIDVDQDACVDCEWSMDSISTYDEQGLLDFENNYAVEDRPVNLTNFNETNFLINEFDVGTSLDVENDYCTFDVPDGTVVTWNMMQRAMWQLVDYGLLEIIDCDDGTLCGDIAQQLVDCASTKGFDYLPHCCPNSKVGVMIAWDDPETQALTAQEILVEVPVAYMPGVCPEGLGGDVRSLSAFSNAAYAAAAAQDAPQTIISQDKVTSFQAQDLISNAMTPRTRIVESELYCQNKI